MPLLPAQEDEWSSHPFWTCQQLEHGSPVLGQSVSYIELNALCTCIYIAVLRTSRSLIRVLGLVTALPLHKAQPTDSIYFTQPPGRHSWKQVAPLE
jgi:hypothetical protein